jgi:hypothetical protein
MFCDKLFSVKSVFMCAQECEKNFYQVASGFKITYLDRLELLWITLMSSIRLGM